MNLDALSFSLAQINYLIANLNKRNFKASQSEIQSIIETSGSTGAFEVERHLFRNLLSTIDFNNHVESTAQQQQQSAGNSSNPGTPGTSTPTGTSNSSSSTPVGAKLTTIGKDHHQQQLLKEFLCTYLTKPHFSTLLCYCIDNPLQLQEVIKLLHLPLTLQLCFGQSIFWIKIFTWKYRLKISSLISFNRQKVINEFFFW